MSKLTEIAIKKAKPEIRPYKMTDGGGMYLLVQPTGTKYWRMKFRIAGKEKLLAFGVYPEITLSQARERRGDARKLLLCGEDPSAVKKTKKQAILQANNNSFTMLATEFHKIRSPMWTTGHTKQWMGNLEKYALPVIGDRPVTEIEPMELVGIMRTIETKAHLRREIVFSSLLARYSNTQSQPDVQNIIRLKFVWRWETVLR